MADVVVVVEQQPEHEPHATSASGLAHSTGTGIDGLLEDDSHWFQWAPDHHQNDGLLPGDDEQGLFVFSLMDLAVQEGLLLPKTQPSASKTPVC